jgi:hypothetical protein
VILSRRRRNDSPKQTKLLVTNLPMATARLVVAIYLRTCSKSFSLKPQQSDTIQGIPVILHTLYAQKVPK